MSCRWTTDTRQALSDLTDGDFFDVVFDATGNPKAMEAGFAYVGHGGTYVLISVVGADITFSDPEFHKREMTLMGSRNATPRTSTPWSSRCARARCRPPP
jgi:threonine dehydrogenase-like Zn-dependent dehydrogenase